MEVGYLFREYGTLNQFRASSLFMEGEDEDLGKGDSALSFMPSPFGRFQIFFSPTLIGPV